MRTINLTLGSRSFTALVAGAVLWTLCLTNVATAQRNRAYGTIGTIDAGTTISVRTTESITAKESDGRVFLGVVDQDVLNTRGNVAIPRGSDVELIVRETSDNEIALDLDSVTVNGRRYGIESESNVFSSERKDSLGANKRTGKYVGGGAALGAIIGAIAGGGKGAAIGAGVGAAAGAGTQVVTRGGSVKIPAESLLTFRLDQPLRAGITDNGYTSNGIHYHPGYNYPSTAAGSRQKPGYYGTGAGDVRIGSNKNISWEGPVNSRVYVEVDNEPARLFAAGQRGTQLASWIQPGHLYVFVLVDANGNEIARDQQDLRNFRALPAYRR